MDVLSISEKKTVYSSIVNKLREFAQSVSATDEFATLPMEPSTRRVLIDESVDKAKGVLSAILGSINGDIFFPQWIAGSAICRAYGTYQFYYTVHDMEGHPEYGDTKFLRNLVLVDTSGVYSSSWYHGFQVHDVVRISGIDVKQTAKIDSIGPGLNFAAPEKGGHVTDYGIGPVPYVEIALERRP